MSRLRLALVLAALVLAPRSARADVDEFGNRLATVTRVIFGLSMPVPVSVEMRAGSTGGASVGTLGSLDGRFYFGHHGVLLGAGFATGGPLAGPPQVGFFDAAYSFADFSARRFRGFGGAFSFDVGPSLGLVQATYDTTPPQNAPKTGPILDVEGHATIGARLSMHADLFVGPVMVGIVLGYRGGVPTNSSSKDNFEGMFFFNLEIGGAFVR